MGAVQLQWVGVEGYGVVRQVLSLAGVWEGDFQALDHEIEQRLPAVKAAIACQGAQVVEAGFPVRQGVSDELVFAIHQLQHGMKEKGQEMEREQ